MSNQPKYLAYTVKARGEGKKDIWTRIGAVWEQRNGGGFNVELEALPFNGKLVLMPPKTGDGATFESEVAQ